MRKIYLFAFLFTLSVFAVAQNVRSLQKKLAVTKDNRQKLLVLDDIAASYLMDGDKDSLATVYGEKQLSVAQLSGDNKLIAYAQFLNGRRWLSMGGVNDVARQAKAFKFLTTALNLSRQYDLPELEAETNIQLGLYYRSSRINDLGKAMEHITTAQSLLHSHPNDSLSVIAACSAAAVYYARADQLNAFRNYTYAVNLAEKIENNELITDTYMALGNFYLGLDDNEKALDYFLKAYKLMESEHRLNRADNLRVLSYIGNVYIIKKDYASARRYFWEAHHRAKKAKLHEIMVNQPLFYIEATYLEEKNDKELLKYLYDPRLVKIIKQYRQEYLMDYYRAAVFDHQNKADSAAFYFNRVIAPAEQSAPPQTLFAIYSGLGFIQLKNGQTASGLQWIEKAKDVSVKLNNLPLMAMAYHQLDSAYAKAGNKSQAYDYRLLYDKYNDSVKSESKARQLTLAEVNAESDRLKARQEKEEEALRKKHNLQYMGITAAIASVFIVLVLTGFFTTSAKVIRGLGFFAFIFFFEFVTLLCDHVIHDWTHGEPLKIMAIKIVFVALLLPVHHYVEEKVIHHLIHRKKIKLSKLAIRRREEMVG